MVDALDAISWFPEEVRRPAVDGLLGNLDVVVQGRSFLIGDCHYCLTESMMDQDPSRGYDELDGEERFVVMQKAYHAHQIVRRLKDQTETVGADPFGSLGLADIIVMLSLLCALHDDGLMDAMRLDSTRECYDVLGASASDSVWGLRGVTIDPVRSGRYTGGCPPGRASTSWTRHSTALKMCWLIP